MLTLIVYPCAFGRFSSISGRMGYSLWSLRFEQGFMHLSNGKRITYNQFKKRPNSDSRGYFSCLQSVAQNYRETQSQFAVRAPFESARQTSKRR